jgi:hypothetical protein
MSDVNVLQEQQLYNYSGFIAVLQARRWEAPKLRIANLSRDIVCLLTQGRTLRAFVLPSISLGDEKLAVSFPTNSRRGDVYA